MLSAGRLCIVLLLFFILSCQTEGEDVIVPQTYLLQDGLISFRFLQKDNKDLPGDITATITGNSIKATLPAGVPKDSLVASFVTKSTGTKVYVGDVAQISHTTANNYSPEIIYKVVSEAGMVTNFRAELDRDFTELDEALYALMQRYSVPGLSVAVTKNDQLVFSRSYGYADKETGELASNQSLFRIASLSKPITSAAILKLVQDGSMLLSDKVFGLGGILQEEYPAPPADANIGLITVQDLVAHKSGWTNNPEDPMVGDYAFTAQQLITNQVRNKALDYMPGATYSYFNLGYCILGRIIEKISGKPYAAFIKENLLSPAGIFDMQIAGDSELQKAANEVKYYQREYSPYSYNMARMDANGGWIATAADLARFMTLVDRNSGKPDLIDNALLETTYFGSPTWSHYGSLPGSTAVITRVNDEYNFVALANTRNNDEPYLIAEELNALLKAKFLMKEDWAETELFSDALLAEISQAPLQ